MRFEEGKCYLASDSGIPPIIVLRRTSKMIRVENGHSEWSMKIRLDKNGNEYVTDSSVSSPFRGAFTYSANWILGEEE